VSPINFPMTRVARHIGRKNATTVFKRATAAQSEESLRGITMCRRRAVVLSAAAMAATVFSANAQDGDVAAGHAFAREACRACHMVDPEARAPRRINIGPAFRDIANTPGMTATAIRVFLPSSHPRMPNLILTPAEIANVTAYILGLLRDRP
jgi:mono/diheme cytochrome c family protein